ncbi:MAG: hypothetical protein GXY44_13270 [Phycisphaerales bacterium]|nr:hypothetical protein [Phycisphaerales bacterium]
MRTQLQLILSTLVMTVLIWAYADRSGYEIRDAGGIDIRVAPPTDADLSYMARIADKTTEPRDVTRVELRLSGPKGELHRFTRESENRALELRVAMPGPLRVGRSPLNLLDVLKDHPQLRSRGLTLQGVTPAMVEVELDRYEELEMDIELDGGSFKPLLVDPVVEPKQITARVLTSALEQTTIPTTLTLFIEENLRQEQLRGSGQEGEILSFNVPVRANWPGIRAKFTPEQVRVRTYLRQQTESVQYRIRPLKELIGIPDFADEYRIEYRDQTKSYLTQTVDVTLPGLRARQLRGEDISAYISIDYADLPAEMMDEGPWLDKPVRVLFPPGFEDVIITRQVPATVELRVVRLSSTLPTAVPAR